MELLVYEGPNIEQTFLLEFQGRKTPISIGRKSNNKNCLKFPDDSHLSSIHAKFEFISDQFFIEDMGSTNGYFYFYFNKL